MDALLGEFSGSMPEFRFDQDSMSVSIFSDQNLAQRSSMLSHGTMDPPFRPNNRQICDAAKPEEPPTEEGDFSVAMYKYIGDILMEEDLEDKNCMLQDSVALLAAEKSFYDVLGEPFRPQTNSIQSVGQFIGSPDDNPVTSCSSSSSNGDATVNSFVESDWLGQSEASYLQTPLVNQVWQSNVMSNSQFIDSPVSAPFNGGSFRESQAVERVIYDLENNITIPFGEKGKALEAKNGGTRGKKKQHRGGDGYDAEERSSKQSALYADECESSEVFDSALLCEDSNVSGICIVEEEARKKLQKNGESKANGKAGRRRKQGNKGEVVDLRALLTQCAQAVAGSNLRSANDLLKLIRQHSSHSGDGVQRLAHFFANSLEARLAGTGLEMSKSIPVKKTPAVDIIKAYRLYVTACPFRRMTHKYANRTIAKLAERETRLHIIDFGVLYGFQWPCLIQLLSSRPSGPPKLRITGIDLPQPGFRPEERVEETGRRLENYCKRFHVPFEYIAIAQKWETIRLEDLKIEKDEVVVVNSLYRLKNLLDETVVANSPRDAVLKLIREINPALFIHGIVNGTFSAPFFVTRFRESLFHFDTLFDMFEATVPHDDQERILFEREVFGMEIMNSIACEGSERFERPETYKQWQIRNVRAGLRQIPLDHEIVTKVKSTVKLSYHKDFVVDEDGGWMLQGWKGRILYAVSCWKPRPEL